MTRARQILEKLPAVQQAIPTDQSAGWLAIALTVADDGASPPDELGNKVLEALVGANIPVVGFETEGNRLQDVFLGLTSQAIQ